MRVCVFVRQGGESMGGSRTSRAPRAPGRWPPPTWKCSRQSMMPSSPLRAPWEAAARSLCSSLEGREVGAGERMFVQRGKDGSESKEEEVGARGGSGKVKQHLESARGQARQKGRRDDRVLPTLASGGDAPPTHASSRPAPSKGR